MNQPRLHTSWVLILFATFFSQIASAQPIYICNSDNSFDLIGFYSDNLNDCGIGSYLEVTSTGVTGVSTGIIDDDITVNSDGTLAISVMDVLGTECESLSLAFDLVEANFTATPLPNSCQQADITSGALNDAGCVSEFIIQGISYPGPDLPAFQFPNSGTYNVIHRVTCGSCVVEETVQVSVEGPQAGLDISGTGATDVGNATYKCDGELGIDITVADASFGITDPGATYNLVILDPSGNQIVNTGTLPVDFTIGELGTYQLVYTVNQSTCTSQYTEMLYVYDGDDQPVINIFNFNSDEIRCEDEILFMNVCFTNQCDNPPGTLFRISLICGGEESLLAQFSNDEVTGPTEIQMNAVSCGSSECQTCDCSILVSAQTPCIDFNPSLNNYWENELCPFQIAPAPDAQFEISPSSSADEYCVGEDLVFEPIWQDVDCNGLETDPSLCEISNPQWIITPDANYNLLGGSSLNDHPLNLEFTQPGIYEVTFEWSNQCSIVPDSYSRIICITPTDVPSVAWPSASLVCMDAPTVLAEVELPDDLCTPAEIEWTGSGAVSFSDASADATDITFATPGNYSIQVEATTHCASLTESFDFTVCDAPVISLSETTVNLCIDQEFCFAPLATINSNNCPAEVTWDVDGTIFVDPVPDDLCLSWGTIGTYPITISAENECGNVTESITVVVSETPVCPISAPDSICDPFNFLDLADPLQADPGTVTWFSSTGGGFSEIIGGMPVTTSTTTSFYATCEVNGCDCISNTLEVFFAPAPSFSIVSDNTEPCEGDEVCLTTNLSEIVDWSVDGVFDSSADELCIVVNSEFTVSGTYPYFTAGIDSTCFVETDIDLIPTDNPIILACDALPDLICDGDTPIPLPLATPTGGIFTLLDVDGNTVVGSPTLIDPASLSAGDYELRYELTGVGASLCDFSASCFFSIVAPQLPQISPDIGELCFNEFIQFTDLSGLNGDWASSCPGSITLQGLFQPELAACPTSTPIEISYTGNCIRDTSFEVSLIETPSLLLTTPPDLCANACLNLSADINGPFDNLDWTVEWATGNDVLNGISPEFCPSDYDLFGGFVNLELVATIAQCSVITTGSLELLNIPEDGLVITSPQCLAGGIQLPDCQNCDAFEVAFTSPVNGQEFLCENGDINCVLPDTGTYTYEVIFEYGACRDTSFGDIIAADIPELNILEAVYDSCGPIVNYTVNYSGFDLQADWSTAGSLLSNNATGNNNYQIVIDHSGEVNVNTIYTDVIEVSNLCGAVSDEFSVFHLADPDFTLDPDTSFYCEGAFAQLEIEFPQPINVDSIRIVLNSEGVFFDSIFLDAIPDEPLSVDISSATDTTEFIFTVTAHNSCNSISKQAVAYVLPIDVAADFELDPSLPVCVGDTIPLVFTSEGNVNAELRQIQVSNPDFEVYTVLQEWFIIPGESVTDGSYNVQLLEYGNCGIDIDQEQITIGPTLKPEILSSDICFGEPVILTPQLTQDAQLTWTLNPDSIVVADFPAPMFYEFPGTYFPSLKAVAEGFCDGFYRDTVEVFAPANPILRCNPNCDDKERCSVNFGDGELCIEIEDAEEYFGLEWFVNGRFSPQTEPYLRIPLDELKPCIENNIVVRGFDQNGCFFSKSVTIPFSDVLIYTPNSFSPNGDGINESFLPSVEGKPIAYSLRIFNRYGKEVFHTNDPNTPWAGDDDGNEYYGQSQVYSYLIQYLPCNPINDDFIEEKGFVMLIR